jgi:hypothetical protein
MTQSQKEFEEWFFGEVDGGAIAESLCWQAWKASRAAIVVELPCWSEYDSPRQYMDAVRQQLDELGVEHISR